MRLLDFMIADRLPATKQSPRDSEPLTAAQPDKAPQTDRAKVEELDVLDAA